MLLKSFISFSLLITSSFCYSQISNNVLFIKGDYDAILENTKYLKTADDFAWQSMVLGKLNMNLRAIEVLSLGMTLFPSPELERMLARQLYDTGQFRKAKPLLYNHSDSSEMLYLLVNILESEGNYMEGITLVNNRLATDSLNTSFISRLGSLYYQKKDDDSAIYYFMRSLELNTNDQVTANKLANLLLKNKLYDQAIVICDKVLAEDSTLTKFIFVKAMCHFKKNNFVLAKSSYYQLAQNGDSSLLVLKNLGICELKTDEFLESRKLLLKAFQLDSSDVEISFYLGKAFYNSMTPEVGLDFLNKADSLLRPKPMLLSLICLEKRAIYSIMGEHSTAIACYEQAYQYNHDPQYKFYIADIYQRKLGNRQLAVVYYEAFLSEVNANNTIDMEQLSATEQSLIMQARQNISMLKEELFFAQ